MSVPSGKILAQKLFNAAYRNGNIDAEDRWSDKKYREVAEEAKAALDAVVEALTAAEQRIAELEAAMPQPCCGDFQSCVRGCVPRANHRIATLEDTVLRLREPNRSLDEALNSGDGSYRP